MLNDSIKKELHEISTNIGTRFKIKEEDTKNG